MNKMISASCRHRTLCSGLQTQESHGVKKKEKEKVEGRGGVIKVKTRSHMGGRILNDSP